MILADGGSFLTALIMTLVCGVLGVALTYTGWIAIKTKKAKARKLERIWANEDGQITGTMAVAKGFVLFLGGIVLTLMAVVGFGASIYRLVVG